MANGTLKVGTITTSSGSGSITIPSGVTLSGGGIDNTPAFEANISTRQTISDNTATKVQCNTEVFDSDGNYDNSSNYRFTIPTGGAGKYNVYLNVGLKSGSNANFYYGAAYLYKNGSAVRMHWIDTRTNYGREYTAVIQTSLDLSEGDYLEAYGYVNVGSSTPTIENAKGSTSLSVFGAYKIGA